MSAEPAATAAAPAVAVAEPPADLSPESLRDQVTAALEAAGQRTLAYMLSEGEWTLVGTELNIRVPKSPTVVDMALGPEPRRQLAGALQEAAGRPLRFKVIGAGSTAAGNGTNGNGVKPQAPAPPRGRVADEPVVRRMQEKFGAEIRSVIDHKNKR
jgi:DNA polymerase-3 subunit gamma/tau